MKLSTHNLGIIAVFIGACCWALGGASGQYLFINNNMTSDWLVPVRLFCAGIIMLTFAVLRGHNIFEALKKPRDIIDIIIFAIIGNAGTQYGYYTCIEYSNVAFATFLAYTTPVIVLFFTVIKELRLPKFKELLSIILVLIGTFFISTHCSLDSMSVSPQALNWGLFGALCYAVYMVQPVRMLKEFPIVTIVGWGMLLGSVPLAIMFTPWVNNQIIVDPMLYIMMAGVIGIGTIIAFSVFEVGIHIIGPVKASILSAIEPVFSVLICLIGFGMPIVGWDILGLVFILAAVFVVTIKKTNLKIS